MTMRATKFLLFALLMTCASSASAAQLAGWIEPTPTAVDLTAEGTRDWIQGGYNGDATKLNRKAGANILSGLTVKYPDNNGTLVRAMGATLSWSDGTPDTTCTGTSNGIHAQGADNAISFTVPAGPAARTIRIYSSSVHAAMQFRAHLSDGSAPDWVNEDWYATDPGSITPRATLCFAAASAGQSLTVTIANISGSNWPSVGIHAVTLQEGATTAPAMLPAPAPTGLRATAGNGQVMVQWNQGPFAASYNVYRSTSASIPATPWRSGLLPIRLNYDSRNQMLSTLDATATNGTTWHYWVAAVNAGGETRAPLAVTATPTAPASTAITTSRLLKIMPMGDSITFGYPVSGGYRQRLLQNLGVGGYQVQTVGRVGTNSTGMAEPLHEGWPGKQIEYLRDSVVDAALPSYQPDLILLMIGTNNLAWGGKTQVDVDNALSAYDGLLAKIIALAPNATVIVSPILPIQGTDLPTTFNQALHTRVTTLAGQGRQVFWCSQMSAITLAQLGDGVHPNAGGYTQMGDAWYAAIQALANGTPTSQVTAPQFSPAGGSFSSAQAVSILCSTAGASLRYTTDGSTPSGSSPLYSSALTVSSTTTIKALAQKSGWSDSSLSSATYTITPVVSTVSTPTFSPAGGTFASAQSVSLSSATSGAAIHYTIDGSTPSGSSPLYGSPIAVGATTTINVLARKSGMNDSAVASATFTITPVVVTAATPNFSPAGGSYATGQSVTISTSTTGATIRYTTDGSTPNGSSSIYASAIAVSVASTIKALAQKSGMTDSPVAVASYTITSGTPAPAAATAPSSQRCGSGSGLAALALLSLALMRGHEFSSMRIRR